MAVVAAAAADLCQHIVPVTIHYSPGLQQTQKNLYLHVSA